MDHLPVPIKGMGQPQKEKGVSTLDMAKRMMLEPTETESRETLEDVIEILICIAREVDEQPELVKEAPHHTCIGRLDEVKAVREPVLRWRK